MVYEGLSGVSASHKDDEIWKSQRDDRRSFTAKHFIAQGMAKTTIYRIMKRYEQEGSVVRATGSGRRATKMTCGPT